MLCTLFAPGSRALIALLTVAAAFFLTYAVGLSDSVLQLVSAGYGVGLAVCAWRQLHTRHAGRAERRVGEVA